MDKKLKYFKKNSSEGDYGWFLFSVNLEKALVEKTNKQTSKNLRNYKGKSGKIGQQIQKCITSGSTSLMVQSMVTVTSFAESKHEPSLAAADRELVHLAARLH